MRRQILKILLALVFCGKAFAAPPAISTVSTFECMSLYWPWTDDLSTATGVSVCTAEYSDDGGTTWYPALDLWADTANSRFTGSVVHLDPATEYTFRLTCDAPSVQTTVTASTWSETFPEGTVTQVGTQTSTQTWNTDGNSGAYRVYENGTITVAHTSDEAVILDASYVIIRNITFVGALKNCIRINNGNTDIVIENCTFSGFGEAGEATGPGTLNDERDNAAIACQSAGVNSALARLVIQNNTFISNSSGSNDWDDGHPTGSHAVWVFNTDGNHVIRYNRIYADNTGGNRRLNDGIGGGANGSTTHGNLNKDSDVYGNHISDCLDDGLEIEGSNVNIRIWNNYTHHCHVSIATAGIKDGPVYTWRNVATQCKADITNDTDSAAAYKTGNTSPGRQYWFFNVITEDGATNGHSEGWSNSGGGDGTVDWFGLNNIVEVEGRIAYDTAENATTDLENDLIDKAPQYDNLHANNYGNGTTPPSGGVGYYLGTAIFASGGPFSECNANSLTAASDGYRDGVAVPNFGMNATTRATISDPDVGAMDARMVPFVFGIQMPAVGGGSATVTGTLTIGP